MLFLWIVIFIVSLFVLIKAADYFTESSEKIGLALRLPSFIIGVTIVSIGTSIPELASSLVAVFKGETAIVVANALGSNIANIFLIIGLAAIVAGTMTVKRSLVDIDLSLLAITTVLIVIILWDRKVVFGEAVVVILGYIVYAAYTFSTREKERAPEVIEEVKEDIENLPIKPEHGIENRHKLRKAAGELNWKVAGILFVSVFFVYLGAEGTIRSVLKLSELLTINTSTIVMSALAIGTSLPEIVVSLQVVKKGKHEMALGNIFGSNVFNSLMVIGIPALFQDLRVDERSFTIGIPFLIGATFLYIISGISKNIHNWEGAMYLLIYALFIIKLFGLF